MSPEPPLNRHLRPVGENHAPPLVNPADRVLEDFRVDDPVEIVVKPLRDLCDLVPASELPLLLLLDSDELSEPLVHRLEHRPLDEGVEPNSPDRVDLRPVELRFPIRVICHLVLPFLCAETTVVSTLHMMP